MPVRPPHSRGRSTHVSYDESSPSVSSISWRVMHHCPFAAQPSRSHDGSSSTDSVVLDSDSLDELSASWLVVELSAVPPVLVEPPSLELDDPDSELELGSAVPLLELDAGPSPV